ncbi:hypothetical protein CDV31_010323 [Fusarium ambrosium]|uniref:Cupin type-1 domain-containing protein n=1 Tax=Fusarium ambrosium TaxID=131363 RepID=A0A428TP65_9HYPO|nr:hypothetical protein CEP53_009722 [Fusarium sp. AF-6]RSM03857.1 hypothetical protein CDV31_010323 [Fusarium ambrosium]
MEFPNVDLKLRWQDQNVVKKDGQWTVDGRPTVGVAVSHVHQPPNIPGQTWLGLTVTAPVNAATPPHTHAGAAVVATVIRGHVLNQMVHSHVDPATGETHSHDSGAKIYGPGESWYEAPGCHHVRSETVGDEECSFIANLIVSTDTFKGLDVKSRAPEDDLAKILRVVIIDKEVEEQQAAAAQQ